MSYLTSFVNASKLYGVAGLGIMTGVSIAASMNTMPALLESNLPADKLVEVWYNLTKEGNIIATPLTLSTIGALFFVAYQRYTHPPLLHITTLSSYIHISEGVQLGISGALLIGVGLYTRILMTPKTIHRLRERKKTIDVAKRRGLEPHVEAHGVKTDLHHWSTLSRFRSGMYATALLLVVTSF
ncbi:hypothetical protein FRB94_004815 [Tulasnella sp. JGI-2019a]|nr:hypothetical protein FRB94_004815 [Tulasnella sp. JGI-2019a]